MEEIRRTIPLQCEIKAECKIGFLRDKHVLIRLTTLEDYVQMRPLKWEPWFNSEAKTTMTLAWISFPGLSPNFFVK
ncbi:hypothetical protein H5410_005648 [Solanum commersonii]|uniref:DUF4283 domain-containing protein n=1 Tax=Solanum commersonii TaxID=4109 RepID=A0A9J6A700_SOLCO|nr:hypothetical protein H5410_005648 [Solanum commersonii]